MAAPDAIMRAVAELMTQRARNKPLPVPKELPLTTNSIPPNATKPNILRGQTNQKADAETWAESNLMESDTALERAGPGKEYLNIVEKMMDDIRRGPEGNQLSNKEIEARVMQQLKEQAASKPNPYDPSPKTFPGEETKLDQYTVNNQEAPTDMVGRQSRGSMDDMDNLFKDEESKFSTEIMNTLEDMHADPSLPAMSKGIERDVAKQLANEKVRGKEVDNRAHANWTFMNELESTLEKPTNYPYSGRPKNMPSREHYQNLTPRGFKDKQGNPLPMMEKDALQNAMRQRVLDARRQQGQAMTAHRADRKDMRDKTELARKTNDPSITDDLAAQLERSSNPRPERPTTSPEAAEQVGMNNELIAVLKSILRDSKLEQKKKSRTLDPNDQRVLQKIMRNK